MLALGQVRDDGVGLGLELPVTRAGEHQGAGGEVVAHGMTTEFGLLPASEGLARRGQAGGLAEVPQQAVGFEGVEVVSVALHRVAERTLQQSDVAEVEGLGLELDGFASAGPDGGLEGDILEACEESEDHDKNIASSGHCGFLPGNRTWARAVRQATELFGYTRRQCLGQGQIG